MIVLGYILLGLVAGSLSGLIGIGGGVIIVPALVILFGLSQHTAQGTTLALLVMPVGLLAAWTYLRSGHADLRIALFIALGFIVGGLIGAQFANSVPESVLRKIFAVTLILIAVRMFFTK